MAKGRRKKSVVWSTVALRRAKAMRARVCVHCVRARVDEVLGRVLTALRCPRCGGDVSGGFVVSGPVPSVA